MDPLSALSLAGTIVQFIDFGSRLLLQTKELYTSSKGQLAVHEEIELSLKDLRTIVQKLRQPISTDASIRGSAPEELSDALEEICRSTVAIADEIISKLDELKIKTADNRKWTSFKQIIRTMWSKDDIDELLGRIAILTQSLKTRTLFAIRDNLSAESVRVSNRFDRIDHETQRIMACLLDSPEAVSFQVITALGQMMSRLEDTNQLEHRRTREIIREYMDMNELVKVTASIEMLAVSSDEESQVRKLVAQKILDQLLYSSMTTRYEAVAEAYPQTFEWAFRDSTADQRPWSNLAEWLKTGGGVYWIRGKAGSGKSTLMKHIYNEPESMRYLQQWAIETEPKNTPLCIATFFFWNSGSAEQKSQKGLLRALLYQVLEKLPDLTSLLFPDTWATTYSEFVSKNDPPQVNISSFSDTKLLEALRILVNQKAKALKIFFLIDGLDEFEGDHEEISELFKDLTLKNSQRVKVCLSSRPLVVFDDCFASFATLQLQNLTHKDIDYFVQNKFRGSPAFQRLEAARPEETAQLVKEIVQRADGVFLWVKIVVDSLLRGIRNKDSISDLMDRLRLLPTELKPLYAHMLGSIDPVYMKWVSAAFQIVRTHRELDAMVNLSPEIIIGSEHIPDTVGGPLSLFQFYLATEEEEPHCIHLAEESVALANCEALETRLRARCAGLLEISDSSTESKTDHYIQYLHTTAAEFIEQEETWRWLISFTANLAFKPRLVLVKGQVMRLWLKLHSLHPPTLISKQWLYQAPSQSSLALMYILSYANVANLQREDWEILSPLFDILETSVETNNGGIELFLHEMIPFRYILSSTSLEYDGALPALSFLELATLFQLTNYTTSKLKDKSQAYLSRSLRLVLYCYKASKLFPRPTIDCILGLLSLGAIPHVTDKLKLQYILGKHMSQTISSYRYSMAGFGIVSQPQTDDGKLEVIDIFIASQMGEAINKTEETRDPQVISQPGTPF